MYKKPCVSVKHQQRLKGLVIAVLSGLFMVPAAANAGTFTGGATFPEQIVQEATSLEDYAKNVTTALSSVQNEINTLNGYMTDLQNLATLPAREIGKITMPIQQMEYNYEEVQGLMSEYKSMYGNLSNIQQTVEQQNADILNSSLSPEDYLNAVETSQSNSAAQARAAINSAANSMKAVNKLAPEIENQSSNIPYISGNTGGQMQIASELSTIEQQNQLLLSAINQAQLKHNTMQSHELKFQHIAESATDMKSQIKDAKDLGSNSATMGKTYSTESSTANKNITNYANCIGNGGTYLTCGKDLTNDQ